MAKIGVFFSSEERSASEIVRGAQLAEELGFETAWISDHFHPWVDEQGESPFVWSVLGGIAATTSQLRVHTAVTCPTVRTHPGIVAHAAATVATMMPGRFGLGVGSGEALNEHVFGARWPSADIRLEMLEEAVAVIRLLWEGGTKDHRGRFYELENARLYSLPEDLPPIHVSGFGPKAQRLAAAIGDGFMCVGPDADAVATFREAGGKGTAHTSLKSCFAPDERTGKETAHRLWPNAGLPGELAQILPTPQHFRQAAEIVDVDTATEGTPCGPDPEVHAAAIREHLAAGYDEVYVGHIGDGHEEALRFLAAEVVPLLDGVDPLRPPAT